MEIPERFRTREFVSQMFRWALAALKSVEFRADVYGTDLHATAQNLVGEAYKTVLGKLDDYPTRLAERYAREEAERRAARNAEESEGREPDASDRRPEDERRRQAYTELYEGLRSEYLSLVGSDVWWPQFFRRVLHNHARNEQRKAERAAKKLGVRVTTLTGVRGDAHEQSADVLDQVAGAGESALDRLAGDATWQDVKAACGRVVRRRKKESGCEESEAAFVEIVRRRCFEDEPINEAHRAVCPGGRPFSRATAHRMFEQLVDELYDTQRYEPVKSG